MATLGINLFALLFLFSSWIARLYFCTFEQAEYPIEAAWRENEWPLVLTLASYAALEFEDALSEGKLPLEDCPNDVAARLLDKVS
jgi:hypothetical protein